MKKICVIGSCNMDLFYDTDKIPKEGETVIGNSFSEDFGGKGANQAIAATKLGGDVSFIGKVGKDTYGEKLIQNFKANNVNIEHLEQADTSTGLAIIGRCNNNNRITIIPGANNEVSIEFIESIKDSVLEADILLCQLEIPMETVEYLAELCKEYGKIFVLNPAPAQKLSEKLIENCTYIIPNEIEILEITDDKDIDVILKKYPEKMILTNGSKGVSYCKNSEIIKLPAVSTIVEDTTGAGDTLNGAFTYAISNDIKFEKAVEFANTAAALSVAKKGAQTGMPNLAEVMVKLESLKNI